jgi:hypothetical protein
MGGLFHFNTRLRRRFDRGKSALHAGLHITLNLRMVPSVFDRSTEKEIGH